MQGNDEKEWMDDGLPVNKNKLPFNSTEKKSNHKLWYALFLFLIGGLVYLLITISLSLKKEIYEIKKTQKDQFNRHVETNQFLLSTIDWSSRRENMIIFMRDKIFEEWRRIGHKASLDEAFFISETIVRECESYSYIDPFLIMATQCVESSFIREALSPVGAKGINQIMSSTGRLLAAYFGYEYSDTLLYNVQISSRFAIKLMDILYAQYGKWDVCLADYNGGPRQAYYYINKKDRMTQETKKYVPYVLKKKSYYDSTFSRFRINEKVGLKVIPACNAPDSIYKN
jgi:hypothetical protein